MLGILGCNLHMGRVVGCRLVPGVELGFRLFVVTMELLSTNHVLALVDNALCYILPAVHMQPYALYSDIHSIVHTG